MTGNEIDFITLHLILQGYGGLFLRPLHEAGSSSAEHCWGPDPAPGRSVHSTNSVP
jgi:hypothetical protein